MKEKYKSLAKNSVIFAVANFGSKILKFLIVPLYTYSLTTSQYGSVDILTTTISLLSPVLLLGMNEAALRFSMKEECNPQSVFTNCSVVLIHTSILSLFLYFIVNKISVFLGHWWLFYLILIFSSLETMLMYYARGVGRNLVFATSGLVNTVVLLTSNVILLIYFKAGETGYLLSLLLASAINSIYLFIQLKLFQTFHWKLLDRHFIFQMLKYSLPLMPNAIMWWIMNASDRYVVLWMMGTSASGIYAISYKIPSVMLTFTVIFSQAWQISAIQESESDEREEFYSSVFDAFAKNSIIIAAFIILIIKPVIFMTFEEAYLDSWKYAPFLVLGAAFSGMSGFMGVNYTVSEKTFGAFATSAVGAATNVLLNFVLTPFIGMYGTAIATFFGFYILWMIRTIQTTKYLRFKIDMLGIHLNLILVIIETVILLLGCKTVYLYIPIIFMLFINRKIISHYVRMLSDFFKGLKR